MTCQRFFSSWELMSTDGKDCHRYCCHNEPGGGSVPQQNWWRCSLHCCWLYIGIIELKGCMKRLVHMQTHLYHDAHWIHQIDKKRSEIMDQMSLQPSKKGYVRQICWQLVLEVVSSRSRWRVLVPLSIRWDLSVEWENAMPIARAILLMPLWTHR